MMGDSQWSIPDSYSPSSVYSCNAGKKSNANSVTVDSCANGSKLMKLANEQHVSFSPIVPEVQAWDVFRLIPEISDSYRQRFWLDVSLQFLKLLAYLVTFALLLGSAVIAKATILLMTSGIGWGGHNFTLCNSPNTIGAYTNNTIIIENKHVVKWVWSLYLAVCAPEIFCFIRCIHRVFFRSVKKPTMAQFFCVFVIETMHATGIGLLLFKVLPGLDAVTGAMLSNCLCIIPAILTLLSRKPGRLSIVLVILDLIAIAAQSSGFWAWPIFIPELATDSWAVPLAIFLISLGWWENFVHVESIFPFIRRMARISQNLRAVRSKTYVIVSLWKCLVYFCALCAFISMRMKTEELMERDPFGAKPIKVIVWRPTDKVHLDPSLAKSSITNTSIQSIFEVPATTAKPKAPNWSGVVNPSRLSNNNNDPVVIDVSDLLKEQEEAAAAAASAIGQRNESGNFQYGHRRAKRQTATTMERLADRTTKIFYTTPFDALWVAIVQIISAFFCYQCAKFACKVMMQRVAFATPISLSVPCTVFILLSFCANRTHNNCFLTGSLPYEMFWRCYATKTVQGFFGSPQTWFWLIWLTSQIWITVHIWMPKCERLADTDRLFVMPWFTGAFIDQSLALNRRRDDKMKIKTEEVDLEGDDGTGSNLYETIPHVTSKTVSSVFSETGGRASVPRSAHPNHTADAITKIFACATMWHETSTEMMCMLKSIFRLDEDQCARRNAQKYLKVIDPDYYEFEAHIFFDDAFDTNDFGEPVVNRFVKQLLSVTELAAAAVHQTNIRVKPPKKYSTPYGGQLVWTLPGRNKLSVHLKDKSKIRVRKRWSQVMYMYYLLGHRVMEKVEDIRRKEIIAENTYILTLDGDVDFKPSAVHLLVDLMRKNRRLGAACGRMHPRGTGPMVWYQKFEYAIGHWFQKATEHMIGCVLCAPGCFSLFRSAALMDDDVLRKYAIKSDKAKDYIQYDQGEDRWLCTLLLQRGYRVEYCAASDALTYAPEGFDEFFNQRRRWVPSTVANILDLLSSYRNMVKVNDSISIWYVLYQFSMLISSVLGPGTIFLMVVGAVNISFGWETYQSLLLVLLPVAVFGAVCLLCKSETQLILAQIIGSLFALLMMAVIVGTALQIKKDGMYSPHAIFLVGIIISFFIAALLHPLEFSCIIPGILYFLSIPCMYMLLIIYSICNLHVVSWGTREVKGGDAKDQDRKKGKLAALLTSDSTDAGELDGVYSFGCGTACRLMCCLQPSAIGNSPQMTKLNQQLETLAKKLDKMDNRLVGPLNRRSSLGLGTNAEKPWENQGLLLEEDEPIDDNFDVPYNDAEENGKIQHSEAWLNDKALRQAERDHLDRDEEKFWKEIIEKYLFPLQMDKKHQEQISANLVELRNKCAGGFFMLNALFVLIVFLLQLQKNCLHIEWPLGPMVNRSIVPCDYYGREESVWRMTRLQLEPIGVVFLIFFVSLLLLQFFCMLLHRFGTLSHILASTELFCFRKSLDKLSEDELVVQNAVEIVKELQAIRGIDEDGSCQQIEEDCRGISRRRVVKSLENSRRSMMKRRTDTLDAAFKKRFFALSSSSENGNNWKNGYDGNGAGGAPVIFAGRGSSKRKLTLSKGTIRVLEMRRNSVFGTLDKESKNPYGTRTSGNDRGRLSGLFNDHGARDSSSDEDSLKPTPASRPSNEQAWMEKENVVKRVVKAAAAAVGPTPVRKLVASSVSNAQTGEHAGGLLPGASRQSSTSSAVSNENVESRF